MTHQMWTLLALIRLNEIRCLFYSRPISNWHWILSESLRQFNHEISFWYACIRWSFHRLISKEKTSHKNTFYEWIYLNCGYFKFVSWYRSVAEFRLRKWFNPFACNRIMNLYQTFIIWRFGSETVIYHSSIRHHFLKSDVTEINKSHF